MNKMVVLNHKNFLEFHNVRDYLLEIKDYIRNDLDVVMCPSNVFLPFFHGKYSFMLGVQDIGLNVTGDVSSNVLKSMDVRYAIIGHGERKAILNENSKIINMKIKECIGAGISPIVCVGESFEERTRKKTQDVIVKQIREYFRDVDVREDIIICYEPMFAIGGDNVLSNNEIKEVVDMIKTVIFRAHHVNVRVLYGGGVDEKSIKSLAKIIELDGFMLGSVSVMPRKVLKVFNTV